MTNIVIEDSPARLRGHTVVALKPLKVVQGSETASWRGCMFLSKSGNCKLFYLSCVPSVCDIGNNHKYLLNE